MTHRRSPSHMAIHGSSSSGGVCDGSGVQTPKPTRNKLQCVENYEWGRESGKVLFSTIVMFYNAIVHRLGPGKLRTLLKMRLLYKLTIWRLRDCVGMMHSRGWRHLLQIPFLKIKNYSIYWFCGWFFLCNECPIAGACMLNERWPHLCWFMSCQRGYRFRWSPKKLADAKSGKMT